MEKDKVFTVEVVRFNEVTSENVTKKATLIWSHAKAGRGWTGGVC